jgi:hypothetical protein
MVTVSGMSSPLRPSSVVLAILWLGTLAVSPAAAHTPLLEVIAPDGPAWTGEPAALPGWMLSAAPGEPGLPWPAAVVIAAAAALAWLRPRRTMAIALVLLLAIFALEDAVHSVHHGFDQAQATSCAVAAVGAHLTATTDSGADPCEILLAVAALSAPPRASSPAARSTGPDLGRAPPSRLLV